MEREERKIGYLKCFMNAFSESGIDKTSVKKLAKAARMNEASIYQYFENKDEIIVDCVDLYFEQVKRELFPALMDGDKPIETRLRILLNYSSEMSGREKFMVQVLTNPSYGRLCQPAVKNFIHDINEMAEQLSWQQSMPQNLMRSILYLLYGSLLSDRIFNSRDVLSSQLALLIRLLKKEEIFLTVTDGEEIPVPELEEIVRQKG